MNPIERIQICLTILSLEAGPQNTTKTIINKVKAIKQRVLNLLENARSQQIRIQQVVDNIGEIQEIRNPFDN